MEQQLKETSNIGEEEVFSGEGAIGAIGLRRAKRVRSSSEGSPEVGGVRKGWLVEARGKVAGITKDIETAGEEMIGYVTKNFSKERHEGYFSIRVNKIKDKCGEMALELERMGRLVDKICNFEGRVLDKWEEFDRQFGVLEERIVDRVRRENQEVLEKVRSEVTQLRALLEHEDVQRQGDVERMEKVVKGQGLNTRNLIETESKKITQVIGDKVETSIKLVKEGQLKMVAGVDKIGGKVEEVSNKCCKVLEGGRVPEELLNEFAKVAEQVGEVNREIAKKGQPMEVDHDDSDTWSKVVRKGGIKRGSRVVVQTPKDGERDKLREKLGELLNKKSGEVRVRGIRRQGRDFVIEVHDRTDIDRLRALGLEDKGFVVDGEPRLRDPRIIIFDVDNEIGEGELVESIKTRNREIFEGLTDDEIAKEIKPVAKVGKTRNGGNWILQTSPRIFKRVIVKGRIYLGLSSCRAIEHIGVIRCYKCQSIGHTGRVCGANVVCGRCGVEGHHISSCKEPQKVGCGNCRKLGFKDVEHWVGWKGCPAMEMARRRVINNTRYE